MKQTDAKRRARTMDDPDPIADLLQQVISGAASKAGSEGAGFLLSLFGTSGGDQIADQLEELEQQVSEILADLRNDTNKIIATVNWDTLVNTIRAPIADIDANWNDLLTGLNSDSQMTKYMGVGTDLTEISQAVIPGGVDPTSPGLLSDLVAMLLPIAQGVQANQPIPRFDLDSLATAYDGLQRYFKYLLGEQLRSIVILLNAIVYQKKDPKQWIATFTGFVKAECAAFLSATELLVVSYCGDLTVLGLLTGPRLTTNPIVLADTFVNACLAPSHYIFVRIWNGQGNGPFPFATGTSVLSQSAPSLSLTAASGSSAPAVSSDSGLSATTLFPAASVGQWVVFRYGFQLTVPGSGTNTWQLSSFPLSSFFNACVVSSSGGYHPFSASAPQFSINSAGTGATVSTALCNTNVF